MMGNNIFRFKQFSVNDNGCGMKICTDSVLFGAWVNSENASKILDIGTGSGLISLMLAQKIDAHITAIEICKDSACCAEKNFFDSPWNDRLKIINISLEEYVNKANEIFDLIVCNPPWFNSIKPYETKRQNARHRNSLDYETLIVSVKKLLSKNGVFSVVLPFSEKVVFSNIALIYGMYPNKETIILTKASKQPKRIFLNFSFVKQVKQSNNIQIYDEDGYYSNEYNKITNDFYL